MVVAALGLAGAGFLRRQRDLATRPEAHARVLARVREALLLITLVAALSLIATEPRSVALPLGLLAVAVLVLDVAARSLPGALALVGLVLGLLAAEAGVRLAGALGVPGVLIHPVVDPDRVHWHEPGQPYVWTGQPGLPSGEFATSGRWNRWGFNDREPRSASPGEMSVLVVGDSYVEALQVAQGQSFWRVAEGELQAQGTPARFVGLGLSGSGANQALVHLERYGREVGPRVVVYAFYSNDVQDDFKAWREAQAAWVAAPHPWLETGHGHSALVELARFAARRALLGWRRPWPYPVAPDFLAFAPDGVLDVSAAYLNLKAGITKLSLASAALGARFVVLELSHGAADYETHACEALARGGLPCEPGGPGRRLSSWAAEGGYAFVGTRGPLRAAATGERLCFKWDGHYTPAGHRVVGRVLAEALLPAIPGYAGASREPRSHQR